MLVFFHKETIWVQENLFTSDTSMNKFPDNLLAARDNKNKVKGIKPDIQLKKCEYFDTQEIPLYFISSYCTRKQKPVCPDTSYSTTILLLHISISLNTVFKGSIFGLILFRVFINDLPNCL